MATIGAVSGLLVNNYNMDIISNNIANASTIGYKTSTPIFFDIFSRSRYSMINQGSGVGILNVIQNFNNGMLVETGRDLDLGIVEDGFFRLLDPQGHVHYTRNGQFLLDENKNIINMQGMYLTGTNKFYSQGNSDDTSNLEPINLNNAYICDGQATSEITLRAILNSSTNSIKNTDDSFDDLSSSANYVIDIYNKEKQKEKLNITFHKKDKNTWQVNVQSNKNSDNQKIKDIDNSFELKFNSDGEMLSNTKFEIYSKNSKYEKIVLDLTGTVEKPEFENSFEKPHQNGYLTGFLKTFNILPKGEIIGTYSNNQTKSIGQILLSKFVNPEKLQHESGSMWSATRESGQENVGIAGDEGFGVISQRTLEASNVDLNKELINMIIAQRNYQSNAQSFKAEDKIISTLINLK
ncbi:MAG: flagellar hook protein FlgE [Buchnera aphidicola (Brevicoryne brassicae)]|uniref:Flagellar hook protein FlgE n=1 Tax=Buchnera aphidicola (Brevicoryne brassicae) TaxID=911343 RepID=A0AAJ5TX39_9GAMM|nr:flagellar hook protein FlgE [Buchnera aphidicola]QCI19900.1 flagellar hook protein FlgE [Buchnera aphidicola (Brevicoryne brassicae)]WAI18723.1 MAG: flagellar hook protein FlgE [Buchnera aphidicola (Brevicoryne brassicae)]